ATGSPPSRSSATKPRSLETDRRSAFSVPSPTAPMQRKSGWSASGAQRSAPSASVCDWLQRAAQPLVCARVSQSVSSASASASWRRPGSSSSSSAMRSGLEGLDRLRAVLEHLEDGVELRHLEQLPEVRSDREELRLPALVLRRRERADERAE